MGTLKNLLKQHKLTKGPLATWIDDARYDIRMVEAPAVPTSELLGALQWRVKDMFEKPISDYVLEIIEFPVNENMQDKARQVYIVAAEREALIQQIELLHAARAPLAVVDIPDMAQRNLASLVPEDEFGVATLSVTANNAIITLTKKGRLYMARHIDVGLDVLTQDNMRQQFDRVVIEMQRSMDFYASNLKQPPVRAIYVSPLGEHHEAAIAHFTENFFVPVKTFDLNEFVVTAQPIEHEQQARCWFTIGASLRNELPDTETEGNADAPTG
jgi:MSHA biogenesis protein MshI